MAELSLNQQELIQLNLNSSPEKQIRILLAILQNSRIKDSEELNKWILSIGFRKWVVKEIEHLVPQSWDQGGDIQKDINKIFNLVLVDKDINIKLSDSCIFCKIKLLCSKNILTIAICACSKKQFITKSTYCYDPNICEEWHNKDVVVGFNPEATIKNIWNINKKKYWEAYLKKIKPIAGSYSWTMPPPIYPRDIYKKKLLNSNFATQDCNENECNNNCHKINDKWSCRWPLIYIDKFPGIKLQFHLVEKPLIRILRGSYFYTKDHVSDKVAESIKRKLISIDRELIRTNTVRISYKNNQKEYFFLKEYTFKSLNEFAQFTTKGTFNAWELFLVKDDNWPSSQHPFGNSN